jgi:hypothetical protein
VIGIGGRLEGPPTQHPKAGWCFRVHRLWLSACGKQLRSSPRFEINVKQPDGSALKREADFVGVIVGEMSLDIPEHSVPRSV